MINVQLGLSVLIVFVCLINAYDDPGILVFVCFAYYTYEHMIFSHLEFVSIHYDEITDIIIKNKGREGERERETD